MSADLYGVGIEELAEIAHVNRSTASRWKRDRTRIPFAAYALVRLRAFGELELALGPAWAGWRIGRDGALYPPGYRRGYTPGELLGVPYLHGQVRALEQRIAAAIRRRRLDAKHTRRRARGPRVAAQE